MNLEDRTLITNFPNKSGEYKVVQIEIDGSLLSKKTYRL